MFRHPSVRHRLAPGLRRCSRMLAVAAILVMGGWAFPGVAQAAEKVSAKLWVTDALTMPGRPVRLEAKLLRTSLFSQLGLGGEGVEFQVGGQSLGSVLTGGDGRAFLEYTPRMRGHQEIRVKLAPNPRVTSPDGVGTLWCWERRRPILLVDLEAVTEPTKSPLPLPLPLDVGRLNRGKAEPDAAEELKRLAEFFYNVIYVSRSGPKDEAALEEIRTWLRDHRFPSGLAIMVKPGAEALTEKIDEMRAEGWDNLHAGIGRTKEFAEVLLAHRMGAVILPASDKDQDLPRKAKVVKNWKEIRKKL